MKLKTMNKLFLITSLLTVSPTVSKAESVYMCEPCPAGYACNNGVKTICPDGTYSGAVSTSCTKCPEGYKSNSSHTGCDKLKSCSYSFTAKCLFSCSGGGGGCISKKNFYDGKKIVNDLIFNYNSYGAAHHISIKSKNGVVYDGKVDMCRGSYGVIQSGAGATSVSFNITLEHGDSVNDKTCDNGVLR